MSSSRWVALLHLGILAACDQRADGLVDPAPSQVVPGIGHNAAAVPVTVAGLHFWVKPTQRVGGGPGVVVDGTYRAWLGETELSAVTRLDDQHPPFPRRARKEGRCS